MAEEALRRCQELHAVFKEKYAVDLAEMLRDEEDSSRRKSHEEDQEEKKKGQCTDERKERRTEPASALCLFAKLQRTSLIKKLMCGRALPLLLLPLLLVVFFVSFSSSRRLRLVSLSVEDQLERRESSRENDSLVAVKPA